MGKQEELATLLDQIKQHGIDLGQCCAVDSGVFFHEHKYAKGFAEKFDKDLVRVDGQESGWLAKNRE